jgi:hypothetical protein
MLRGPYTVENCTAVTNPFAFVSSMLRGEKDHSTEKNSKLQLQFLSSIHKEGR